MTQKPLGVEQPSEYYDSRMEKFLLPYESSPWRPVYDAVLELMPTDRNLSILDIGCGTGRCADALQRAGYFNYIGFDFSSERINEARRYLPSTQFHVLDVFADAAAQLFAAADVFVVTEVLEHVNRDTEILRMIPTGREVLFSVPSFGGAAHVRSFADVDAVIRRYGELLTLDVGAIRIVPRPRDDRIFVMRGRRA